MVPGGPYGIISARYGEGLCNDNITEFNTSLVQNIYKINKKGETK